MRNQIASEFRKLTTTRSIYAMLAGLIVIVRLGVVATTTDGEPGSLLAPLEHQVFFNVSLTIAPLFGLLLGLRSFTDEFRYGSILPTLLASPVRRRVLGATRRDRRGRRRALPRCGGDLDRRRRT